MMYPWSLTIAESLEADQPLAERGVTAGDVAHGALPPHGKGVWHHIGLWLSGVLLIAVIALAAVVIVVPKIAGATPLTVLTSSMEPSLPPGTLIVVRPVDTDELAIGDVVTYQIESGDPTVVTHRIIAINASSVGEPTFELKGDNNSAPDPDPVVPQQIQGTVWYSVPFVGLANNAMNGDNRSWIIPTAAVLLLGYAGYMIASGTTSVIRKRRRADQTVNAASEGSQTDD